MDNNQLPQTFQPTPTPETPQPDTPQQPVVRPTYVESAPAAVFAPKNQGPGKGKILGLTLLLLLLLGAVGYFAYQQKIANDNLGKTRLELYSTQGSLENTRKELEKEKEVEQFIAKYNDAEMSRRMCSGKTMGMFDVHINDRFAVFRYLCANDSSPVRIGAMKELDGGSYEFTYGSTPLRPNELPDYLFNSEPEFFGPIYGTRVF